MSKYSKSQIEEIAKGVFKNSPVEKYYVDGLATFRTEAEHEAHKKSLEKKPEQLAAYEKSVVVVDNPKSKKAEKSPAAEKPLESMKVDELKALAAQEGVEIADADKKGEIIEKINAKRAEGKEE